MRPRALGLRVVGCHLEAGSNAVQVPRVLAHVRNADQDRTQPRADRASDRAGGEGPVATAKRYADLMPSS